MIKDEGVIEKYLGGEDYLVRKVYRNNRKSPPFVATRIADFHKVN